MAKRESLAEAVIKNDGFKRKFNILELYRSYVYTPIAAHKLIKNNKSKLIHQDFIRRLQLAVTEVNGCAACSYQHTKMALDQGMSNEEITSFLSGGTDYIVTEEAKAILFAQHFADSRGLPHQSTYTTLIEEYGEKEAEVILAACQTMITGNMYGIPFSAFLSRIKGKKYQGSTLFYELGMLIGGGIILPIGIIHGYLRALFGLKNVKFGDK